MYNLSVKEVIKRTETDIVTGLSNDEVIRRLERDGKNVIQENKRLPAVLRFLKQFNNAMVLVLSVAMILTIFIAITENDVKEWISAGLIFVVIFLNASIGFIQENRAEKAIDALRNESKPYAKVLRDGKTMGVKNEDLVIGDIVIIEAGDIIPADLRLFEVANLQVEQAALTGESVPSDKTIETIDTPNLAIGDCNNMVFSGGTVTYGRGKGIVTAIGMQTEIGHIAEHLNNQKTPETPLTKRLNKTSHMIALVVACVAIFIFASRLATGDKIIDSIMITIAIAVCAIPEALPTCISITMALATQRMSKRKAIVRNLPAVETLGSTEVICSDKTGTITLNQMTVENLFTFDDQKYFDIRNNEEATKAAFYYSQNLKNLRDCMLLCNDTQITYEGEVLTAIGDPTETALVRCVDKFHFSKKEIDSTNPRVAEIPFDSERKLMSTVNKTESGFMMYTKGAPSNLLNRCTKILCNGKIRNITPEDIKEIHKATSTFAKSALRVLGYAFKPFANERKVTLSDEQDLVFIGLTGMIDPPRTEVFDSIKKCKQAGIKVVMITGDHRDTAFAIAKQVGIAENEDQVLTGAELNEISDEKFYAEIIKYSVFARVNPEHKVRIVNAFKANDKIVAMTGDGVNDAPSIKAADIGIGMGITGTDVTKKVADVILTDDNFATIVDAVEEGRRTYSNIKKTIIYLLGLSLAELVLLTVIIAFLRLDFFNAILILWINIATDTFPALALGSLPAEKSIMKHKPNSTRGSLFRGQTGQTLFLSCLFAVILIGSAYALAYYVLDYGLAVAITMSYLVLVIVEIVQAYNLFSSTGSIFSRFTFKSKWMNMALIASFFIGILPLIIPGLFQEALGLVSLDLAQWILCVGIGLMMIFMFESYKIHLRAKHRSLAAKQD